MFAHNLLCMLGRQDSTEAVTLGMNHCKGPNFKCKTGGILSPRAQGKAKGGGRGGGRGGGGGRGDWIGWVNGGAGVVVSARVAASLKIAKCARFYKKHWNYQVPAADVVLSCCLKDVGSKLKHVLGFTSGGPGFYECNCEKHRPEGPVW